MKNAWDAVGFLASGLVITAFCMERSLLRDRVRSGGGGGGSAGGSGR